MRYVNLSVNILTSESFLGSEPIDRATWLCLVRYCCQHETSGIIQGAGSWGDRKWMQLCGITKDEAHRDCLLWYWEGDDLIVQYYPVEQEQAAQARREAGKRYGAGHPKAEQKDSKSSPNRSPESPARDKDKDKDKGKDKGKGKFEPPTVEQVQTYCRERGNSIDPQKFVDFYESKNWFVGKNKMQDWKAAVRTWEKKDNKQQNFAIGQAGSYNEGENPLQKQRG